MHQFLNPLWRQKGNSLTAASALCLCAQGDSCTCTRCAWTAWKGFTRSSASSASRGGTAAGTSWAPCIPTTSWLPLRAVRLVLTPTERALVVNMEELESALPLQWGGGRPGEGALGVSVWDFPQSPAVVVDVLQCAAVVTGLCSHGQGYCRVVIKYVGNVFSILS